MADLGETRPTGDSEPGVVRPPPVAGPEAVRPDQHVLHVQTVQGGAHTRCGGHRGQRGCQPLAI